ncbi:hypothetical protein [Alicyclobacillus shizuokensis]|uniref:hypothetical protein n=1 Tax=Alicyclobacillus shizuokensis TaxID=392014 RepID=UPI00082C4AF3|nr:hypothetical protein [Alicyclobacillus shizuokensis]MCL6627813.1 hypothetical protein [Alicyclobacillus shizuokensis]
MRLDTLVKVGSLAFEVAQDERVREMLTMMYNGAKRRGLMAPATGLPSGQQSSTKTSTPSEHHPVTFGHATPNQTAPVHARPDWEPPWPALNTSRWLNPQTARRAADAALRIGRMLMQ